MRTFTGSWVKKKDDGDGKALKAQPRTLKRSEPDTENHRCNKRDGSQREKRRCQLHGQSGKGNQSFKLFRA